MVIAIDMQPDGRGLEPSSDREKIRTISTPSPYSTCPEYSINRTQEKHLVTDSGAKCVWMIIERNAIQTNVHNTFDVASM